MMPAMFGAETISSFRDTAESLHGTSEAVRGAAAHLEQHASELTRSATLTLDAVRETLPDPVELADAVYEVKTAAQLGSIAFVCVAVVSWCALALAVAALIKVHDK
jgi:hypothetical protein